eukprot:2331068-Heterocapsa_arctica.AAC.1
MEAAMSATPEGADRVRQSAGMIGAHVARAQERDDGEHSSKRQRVATEGGNDDKYYSCEPYRPYRCYSGD